MFCTRRKDVRNTSKYRLSPIDPRDAHSRAHRAVKTKLKYTDVAVRSLTCHSATGTHIGLPYSITQCYLPPDRGDIPALTPAEGGTRLNDPEGYKAELTWLVTILHTEMVYPPEDGHPSQY